MADQASAEDEGTATGTSGLRTDVSHPARILFEGADLVEPGVVSCSRRRPDPSEDGGIVDVTHFCGVARKP
ncbi:SAM-dependent methyltransferase [Streptomyces phyllanthi]|uniref:Uncharacterized protein n=1 Tax=Streptomyces phyllanthi TaxID=1803180 RepID=A0A5N8W4K1_9ACTN|nr:SAM-dependent methyltransferase [Streptomyces phyllanthi]MPY42042.1 hypothetical protein [Streptomyces phyllanthi]